MAKKTGFAKVLGRRDYVVKLATVKGNLKEKQVVTYLDFTGK